MTELLNDYIQSLMTFNTPDTPHKGVLFNQEIDTKIFKDIQKIYSNGILPLLYPIKHSLPELYHLVRELSKFIDKTNKIHYNYILRAIRYVLDTTGYYYQMKPRDRIHCSYL